MHVVIRPALPLSLLICFAACSSPKPSPDAAPGGGSATPELGTFGVDLSARDTSVKPGDDFNRYANGAWYDQYELKPDEQRYGAFVELRYRSEERIKTIIEELAAGDPAPGTLEQKVGDYFSSYLDVETRTARGLEPLQPDLDRIAAIQTREQLIEEFGAAGRTQSNTPIGGFIWIDRKNPDRYILSLGHAGLGLPDRDYYLENDARFTEIRAAYRANIQKMLAFAGKSAAEASAAADAIVALETRIAGHHWPRAKLRDRDATYNVMTLEALDQAFPDYDWKLHIRASGVSLENVPELNVRTPSAMAPLAKIVAETDLATWRDYLTYHTLVNHAELLSPEIDDAAFEFYGKVLGGQQEQREPWKRAVNLVGGGRGLGEALGKIYVDRYFTADAKRKMDDLVANLRAALDERVAALDWMGDATKAEAKKKLESFRPKIGYPEKWRSFEAITIQREDLVANYRAVREYWYEDTLARLTETPDRDEWFMTPQTVNAYYNPSFNEIVFPAAILQPPFFDPNADPAVNYGAIGGVIGHEMGHGFDDQGSKSDWAGVQRNWWTEEDRQRFDAKTKTLVEQYNGFEPFDGVNVNGELTLGENIGDLGGLSMAYHAYKKSLGGKEAPVIDGLTGDQRFFLAWAQVWRAKYREEALVTRIKTDPHSPPQYRVNGVVRNLDPWYAAFDVKEGDALYLPPEERVSIW